MTTPDEREFRTFDRGRIRDDVILNNFRNGLRVLVNPATGRERLDPAGVHPVLLQVRHEAVNEDNRLPLTEYLVMDGDAVGFERRGSLRRRVRGLAAVRARQARPPSGS